MSKITTDEVKHLSALARITISDDEAEVLRADVESILGFIDKLQAVDVNELEATEQVTGLKNVYRADSLQDLKVAPEVLLEQAPDSLGSQFKTKKAL